ncbi:hypothetical protein SLE2022_243300 [Rubroshorea leprosula]
MTNKLKVVELRAELAKRGLDTAGTKPLLVRRLEEAVLKENQKPVGDNVNGAHADTSRKRRKESNDEDSNKVKPVGGNVNGFSASDGDNNEKRERGSDDGDLNKIEAVEKFRQMSLKQLREQASLLGIPATGTKKELLERLCKDAEMGSDYVNEKEDDSKGGRVVTAIKKASVVLDQGLPDDIKAKYHVLQQGDDAYDAMLNQTNIGDNNNKFYVIQLLESDDGRTYVVYNRWGRVGQKGQTKLIHFPSRDVAIKSFEAKFFEKTKNHWANRKDFVCHPKSYTLLEMDYNKQEEESAVKEKPASFIGVQPQVTKLEPRVAKVISLICNVNMMMQQMVEIGYNAEKLPLGKLSKSTILKGYDALRRIADAIGQPDRSKLEQLSSEFYTVIPHDFGFRKMRDFVIDTPSKLKQKLEMVEALGEIEVATKLLKDDPLMKEDPLYFHYQQLHCELRPLEDDSEEFAMIAKYMKNTHAKTHSGYSVDIVQIFKVAREGEVECFKKFSTTKNRMLLWHGSRLTNWTGILSQGLRIAPPEAPVTGYMFGKGVYFADMFSKSANYCYANHLSTAGVLLLCEVALGDMAELLQAKSDADKLPDGKLSTKGVGATEPDPSEAKTLDDGVIVPLGKPKEQQCQGTLLYNEYIVYNVEQIRMRYLVQVNFNCPR